MSNSFYKFPAMMISVTTCCCCCCHMSEFNSERSWYL